MSSSLPNPAVIAHRGASAYAPENTLAAFALAVEHGAPAVEFDVMLTADRQVVVIHDSDVARTTNGKGRVQDMSLAALKELDAGSWKGEQFKSEKIPTLDEVFAAFGRKLFMNIELKNYATLFDGLVNEVAPLIVKHNMQDNILLSSFSPINLWVAQRILPSVPRGLLIAKGREGDWQRWLGKFMVLASENPNAMDVDEKIVRQAHARKRCVYPYTVNDPARMQELVSFGVDGIITDDPRLALETLKQG